MCNQYCQTILKDDFEEQENQNDLTSLCGIKKKKSYLYVSEFSDN